MSDDLLTTGASETGWTPARTLTYEEWAQMGATLQTIHRLTPMWLGDWLNYGERAYGETYTDALLFTDHSLESLKQYKWVMGSVAPGARRPGLTFTHYRIVAKLPPAEQSQWLDAAIQFGLRTKELAEAIDKDKQITMTTTTVHSKPAMSKTTTPPPAALGQWTEVNHQAPAATPPTISAALRRAKVWSAWLLLHSTQEHAPIFTLDSIDEIDNFFGQTIDALLQGTGLESYDIYSKWPDNVVIHGL